MIDKIYKVNVRLNKDGFTETVNEWTVIKEGAKTFNIGMVDKWDCPVVKYKKKDQIGIIDTGTYYNSLNEVVYGAWCVSEDIEKFKIQCKALVIKTVYGYQDALNKIMFHIVK